eukprot:gene21212-20391_t
MRCTAVSIVLLLCAAAAFTGLPPRAAAGGSPPQPRCAGGVARCNGACPHDGGDGGDGGDAAAAGAVGAAAAGAAPFIVPFFVTSVLGIVGAAVSYGVWWLRKQVDRLRFTT